MNENEFNDSGIDYIAVNAKSGLNRCIGCAYYVIGCCEACDVPCCNSTGRTDRRNVIFVEKQQ